MRIVLQAYPFKLFDAILVLLDYLPLRMTINCFIFFLQFLFYYNLLLIEIYDHKYTTARKSLNLLDVELI